MHTFLLIALTCGLLLSRATVNNTLKVSWKPTALNSHSVSYWVCEYTGCSVTPNFEISKTCPGFYYMYTEVLNLDFSSRYHKDEYFQVQVGTEKETCREMGQTCHHRYHEYVDCGNGFNITNNVLKQAGSIASINVTLKIGTRVNCGNPPGTTWNTRMGARVILYCHGPSNSIIPIRPWIPVFVYSENTHKFQINYDNNTWDLSAETARKFLRDASYDYPYGGSGWRLYFLNRCAMKRRNIYASLAIDTSTAHHGFYFNKSNHVFTILIRPKSDKTEYYAKLYNRSEIVHLPTITVTCDSLGAVTPGKPKWVPCFSNLNLTEFEPKYFNWYQSLDIETEEDGWFVSSMDLVMTVECSNETKQFTRTTSTGNPHSYKKTYRKLTSSAMTTKSHDRYDLWIGLGCAFGVVGICVCLGWICYSKQRSREMSDADSVPDEENDDGAANGEIDMSRAT